VRFRERLHLSATETALLVAVPVLVGALARLPIGILADRFGGRLVFSVLMAIVAVPVYLVPAAETYRSLLVTAFFLGLAGSSFAVGVGYVSRWAPADRQGSVLGIYGMGNIGQSAAVFLGPLLAGAIGWEGVFHAVAALLVVAAIGFALLARDAPARGAPKGIAAMVSADSLPSPSTCRHCSRTTSASGPRTPAFAPRVSSCWRR
jgi:NNP family nitrate/nitrite transporter-like MFS transporter